MAEKYNLPEGMNALFLKFKNLLAMMPESASEIEQEQLIVKSVKAEASCQNLSEADRQLLITSLIQEVRFGEIISKKIGRNFPLSTVYKGTLTQHLKEKE